MLISRREILNATKLKSITILCCKVIIVTITFVIIPGNDVVLFLIINVLIKKRDVSVLFFIITTHIFIPRRARDRPFHLVTFDIG